MPTHTRSGKFTTIDDKISTCTCQWQELEPQERTKRALGYLGAFWVGSVVSILIPILHFVLVPGLFFGGIYAALKTYRQNVLLLELQGPCPHCQSPQHFKKLVYSAEMKELCTQCHTSYRIVFG